MEYKVEKNKVEILINDKSLNIELLNKNIVRLYAKKNRCDLIDLNIKKARRNFEVKKEDNSLVVSDRNYKLLFKEDEGVSLYFKDSYLTSISFNKLFDDFLFDPGICGETLPGVGRNTEFREVSDEVEVVDVLFVPGYLDRSIQHTFRDLFLYFSRREHIVLVRD